jgi:hypothetical protein
MNFRNLNTLLCALWALHSSFCLARNAVDYTLSPEFAQRIGYADAIRQERRDGLILIDFRRVQPPPFVTAWPIIADPEFDNWNYFHDKEEEGGECHYFNWGVQTTLGAVDIVARVCDRYELAQKWFVSKAHSSNMYPLPWVKCDKKIGSICAELNSKKTVFFLYKNLAVSLARLDYEPGHEDVAEVVGEWLFEVLKQHPRTPMPEPGALPGGRVPLPPFTAAATEMSAPK